MKNTNLQKKNSFANILRMKLAHKQNIIEFFTKENDENDK